MKIPMPKDIGEPLSLIGFPLLLRHGLLLPVEKAMSPIDHLTHFPSVGILELGILEQWNNGMMGLIEKTLQ